MGEGVDLDFIQTIDRHKVRLEGYLWSEGGDGWRRGWSLTLHGGVPPFHRGVGTGESCLGRGSPIFRDREEDLHAHRERESERERE